tara:strand:- start:77 stop:355 length:279 start_codon:yes stop_codon:yes gene_type:complete
MSGFSGYKQFPSYYIDVKFIQNEIQKCLDVGVHDDETSIKELVRYHTCDVKSIKVEEQRSCNFYVIKIKTVDEDNNEYHYKFFVRSRRNMFQ